jgi:hypothetical protein
MLKKKHIEWSEYIRVMKNRLQATEIPENKRRELSILMREWLNANDIKYIDYSWDDISYNDLPSKKFLVNLFKRYCNLILETNRHPVVKYEVCTMIETILLRTGNYHGFSEDKPDAMSALWVKRYYY